MAAETYARAYKSAKSAYRSALSHGEYPYLPSLDEIIDSRDVRTEELLGLVNIPLELIVGTKTAGRQRAFAANFMPLMPETSEFAQKWKSVVDYHMGPGVGDPITAYEYMNRFYVLEGNKRVSVLKYFHADSIEGTVTRLVPYPENSVRNKIYYEFMDFYRDTQINYLWFSRVGGFPKLIDAVGRKKGEKWTDDEKLDFKSVYTQFSELFDLKGGAKLGLTPADALLFYLSLYSYSDIRAKTYSEMGEDMDRIWAELSLLSDEKATDRSVVLKPFNDDGESVFARFFSITHTKVLKVSFIHDRSTEVSSWTYTHELGRMALDKIFGNRIHTEAHFLKEEDADISVLLQEAIEAENHMIFTTSSRFLPASLKASIEHPEVKILNCSVGQPYKTLRTYFGRYYEAKFLGGMIAGAMTSNDKIAYEATFPNYGTVANINAFALGARMMNPRARVYLHWGYQTDSEPFSDLLKREEIAVVSDNDMVAPNSSNRMFGLYIIGEGYMKRLATPIWNWGKFYERIIRDFLQGNWDRERQAKERGAINYWWGISSGIIDLIMSDDLPKGTAALTNIVKGQIYEDYFNPFWGEMKTQNGRTVGRHGAPLTPEEIITMDYLLEPVFGGIPEVNRFTYEAQEKIALQSWFTSDATVVE